MSRIHEALKRAEQESRARSSSTVSPAEEEPLLADMGSVPVETTESELIATENIEAPLVEGVSAGEVDSSADWLTRIQPKTWNSDSKKILFSDRNGHEQPGMEEFRTLRSRLYQLREKTPLKTIMVASALPGEGKTFVSSNLAHILVRQHGRRVLLIDGDLRKPGMHECLGTSRAPGLVDYLAGNADEASILQRGPLENLFFIPGGPPVTNASELISSGRMRLLINKLAPSFHWIVIDSAPLVPISDGSMLARLTDGVLLVVRAETGVDVVQRAKDELKGRRLLGVVLNRGESPTGYSPYYYRYGGQNEAK